MPPQDPEQQSLSVSHLVNKRLQVGGTVNMLVGALVGALVGLLVGELVGASVVAPRNMVGAEVGTMDCETDGLDVGAKEPPSCKTRMAVTVGPKFEREPRS